MVFEELKMQGIEEGYEISGKPKEITLNRMRKFSGHLEEGENIHTNEKMANESGLPGPIAQGMMSYGYILEMIVNAFGDEFFSGGELEVSFVRYVLPGDTVTAKGRVHRREATHSGTKITLEVWCENQHNEKVTGGTATALL